MNVLQFYKNGRILVHEAAITHRLARAVARGLLRGARYIDVLDEGVLVVRVSETGERRAYERNI